MKLNKQKAKWKQHMHMVIQYKRWQQRVKVSTCSEFLKVLSLKVTSNFFCILIEKEVICIYNVYMYIYICMSIILYIKNTIYMYIHLNTLYIFSSHCLNLAFCNLYLGDISIFANTEPLILFIIFQKSLISIFHFYNLLNPLLVDICHFHFLLL